jgi:DNA (cytosine-5)-methyltransferase 1
MTGAYYNENDKKAATWLRELIKAGLIADGEVDERSIADVRADDLRGFVQCHFFAGIGGWSYALRLAGWPDDRPVWTGSCPCQKHSSAARGRNVAPDLWPPFRGLIAEFHPCTVFGEQVASARGWLDGVCDDVEKLGYSIGAAVLPACGVGLDHVGERIYFVCAANGEGESGGAVDGEMARLSRHRRNAGDVVSAYGLSDRVALLRGFGNAIVPELAAAFIEAAAECL